MNTNVTLFNYLSALDEENLYAILGGNVSFKKPQKARNTLGFQVAYEATATAIRKGKLKFAKLMRALKKELCTEWHHLKENHRGKIRAIDMFNVVFPIVEEAMRVQTQSPTGYEQVAVVVLILKGGKQGLDALCKKE